MEINTVINDAQINSMLDEIKEVAKNDELIDSILRGVFRACGDNNPVQHFVCIEPTSEGITLYPSSYLVDIHEAVMQRRLIELPKIATRMIRDLSQVIDKNRGLS